MIAPDSPAVELDGNVFAIFGGALFTAPVGQRVGQAEQRRAQAAFGQPVEILRTGSVGSRGRRVHVAEGERPAAARQVPGGGQRDDLDAGAGQQRRQPGVCLAFGRIVRVDPGFEAAPASMYR